MERVGIRAVEWRDRNHVAFDNSKNEILAFRRRRKPNQKQRLTEARITVRGHMLGFNTEVTCWLGVYLDTELQFKVHKNLLLEKS